MMSILARHVGWLFLKYWLLSVTAIFMLSFVSSLFWELSELLQSWDHFLEFWHAFITKLPQVFKLSWGLMAVIATSFTYNNLRNSGELLAIRSIGLNRFKTFYPVWVLAVGIAVLGYINQTYFWNWLQGTPHQSLLKKEGPSERWTILGEHLIYIDPLTPPDVLKKIVIFSWVSGKPILKHIHYADSVQLQKTSPAPHTNHTQWTAYQLNQKQWEIRKNEPAPPVSTDVLFKVFLAEKRTPADHIPILTLYQAIRSNTLAPDRLRLYWLSLQQKLARMMGLIMLIYLSILMLDRSGSQRSQPIKHSMTTMLIGLFYIVLIEVLDILGKGLILPVVWASWTPIGILSVVTLIRWSYLHWQGR